ncbi:hypothetical protein ONZ45_g15725 [Pleurotus djamor]|nr:hypothetical protein ONZ45_g15725 [Pleurotus djamor]
MAALLLSMQPGAGSSGEVHPTELARPVESLSTGVSHAITPLYNLHSLLLQLSGGTSSRLRSFVQAKSGLGKEWEGWLPFLRRCMGYSRNYVSLCLSIQSNSGGVSQHGAVAQSLLTTAQEIGKDVRQLTVSYERAVEDIRSLPHARPSHDFDSESRYTSTSRSSSDALYTISGIRQPYDDLAASLRGTLESLRDIAIFWEGHVKQLEKITLSSRNIQDLANEGFFASQSALWLKFHDAMRKALSDITSYCDALTVTPNTSFSVWQKLHVYITMEKQKHLAVTLTHEPPHNHSASTLVTHDAAERWKEGYMVLVSSTQYDVSRLLRRTLRLKRRCRHLALFDPGLASQQRSVLETSLAEIAPLASNIQSFYHLARDGQNTRDAQGDMKTRGRSAHDTLQTILNNCASVHDNLVKLQSDIHSGSILPSALDLSDHGRIKFEKSLKRTVKALAELLGSLISLSDFLVDVIAGAEYMHAYEFPNERHTARLWRKQEKRYHRLETYLGDGVSSKGRRFWITAYSQLWSLAHIMRAGFPQTI